ncbi:hypothetical protein UCRPA7_5343 [Phaeoacremonium minimum UCRPA7]|uniref:Uncharacterized protein n=1 Tax=Phaeoacremonium minimum (strain UCR-PA7) TaxID=1286976 RepID=R8BIF8_PHAM7|nr:hypothetical protein UCRPA7_5343 [Phaeoacremonium minimum UCRPA7]EON99110.1 hypothetical protein UCRPA7_5343 [Phaeoacremonium minimum UCRPA7]
MEAAEKLHAEKNLAGFEELLAGKFGIELRKPEELTNGIHSVSGDAQAVNKTDAALPDWVWPESRSHYPRADRRWIIYAITRVFAWHASEDNSDSGLRLECQLPESSLLNFLIDAGHLTVSNLKSAFKNEVRDVDDIDIVLGESIPQLLVQVEPTFEFLLAYLYSTKLGEVELLTSVRLIMQSLELIQDPTKMAPKLLTFSSHELPTNGEDGEAGEYGEIGMELDRLEQEIQVTESYLGDQSSTRAKGLSVAFGKLGSCPPILTIRFLRQHYKPEEILSLIYVLRMELVKDGWTTRYLDTTRLDEAEDLEPPPDGSIRLIADLLCRCIDSVGPGGWLINDAIISAGTGDHFDGADFLASLKLEVSAALEGVQEAVFLRGIISEAARFGSSALAVTAYKPRKAGENKSLVSRDLKTRELKPIHSAESAMLPLGMKANNKISAEKIYSNGEVVTRSKREVGSHISKKVQAYSLERIVI